MTLIKQLLQLTSKTNTRQAVLHQTAAHILGQLVRLAGNLITTRLLAPDLFGVMLVANSIYAGLELMSDVGIRQALIRSSSSEDVVFQRTVWSLQIVRSFLQFGITIVICSGFLFLYYYEIFPETVYSRLELTIATFFVGFWLLGRGIQSVKIPMLQREMKFGRVSYYVLMQEITSVGFTIIWAYYYPSIFSLCIPPLLSILLYSCASLFVFNSDGNRFSVNRQYAREILAFGKWLLVSSGFGFLGRQGARLVVGVFLSPSEMGYLAIASTLIESLRSLFSRIQTIMYSRLSEVRRNEHELYSKRYYNLKIYQDTLIYFLLGVLLIAAPALIDLLYDARFSGAGQFLQILALQLVLMSSAMQTNALVASGNTRAVALAVIIGSVATLVGVPVAYHLFGATGCVVALAVLPLISIPVRSYFLHRDIKYSWSKELTPVLMVLPGAIVGYGFVWIGGNIF